MLQINDVTHCGVNDVGIRTMMLRFVQMYVTIHLRGDGMKKLFILLFLFLMALSVCGCGDSTTESEMGSISSDEIAAETSRISEDEAIEIASQYWGIKSGDKDEATGFQFLIMPVDSSNDNIKIALKWLVDNHHYSTVDSIEIDPFTGEIVNRD